MRLGPRGIGPGRGLASGGRPRVDATLALPGRMAHWRCGPGEFLEAAGHISTFYDLSLNGRHQVNLSGSASTATILDFPGTTTPSCRYDGNDFYDGATGFIGSSGSRTIIVFAKFEDTAARCLLDTNNGAGGAIVGQGNAGTGKVTLWKKSVAFTEDGLGSTAAAWWAFTFDIAAVVASRLWVNGVEQALTSASALINAPTGNFALGRHASAGIQYMLGHFPEALVLDHAISAANLATIIPYAQTRYAMP